MKRVYTWTLILCVGFMMGCAPTGQVTPVKEGEQAVEVRSQANLPTDEAVTIGQLENGVTYYIRENKRPAKRGELRLVVNAGSVLEDESQQGLAHFTEHMAFNGSKHFKKQELVDYLESIGMRFGPDLNAYTSFDETVYMLQVPTDDREILQQGFLILEDWAHNLNMAAEEIDKERGVIREEWRLGRGAQARMRDEQFPILFKGSRYAERLPIGKIAVIDSFQYETLRRFYRQWYRPDLMGVIAVGDFEKDSIKQLIEKHFSRLSMPQPAQKRQLFPVPGHAKTLYAIATDPEAMRTTVGLYYKHKPTTLTTNEDYRQMIVENLYNGMLNKRLNELTQKADPPFIYGTSAKGRFIRTCEFYLLNVMVREGDIEQGLAALLTEARRVENYGFTGSELQRYKNELMRRMEQAYSERDKTESREFVAEYVNNYLEDEPIPGIEYEYKLYQQYLPEITLQEVNKVAQNWISDSNCVVMVSAPEKESGSVPDKATLSAVMDSVKNITVEPYVDKVLDEPLISEILQTGKIVSEKKFAEIGVTELKLDNGVRVVLKPTDFKNDEILLTAFSPGGHSLIKDEDYIAAVTAAAIASNSGVGEFDKIELEKKLSGKIVRVNPIIKELTENLRASTAPKDLETMFKMVYLNFTAPRMDSTAFQSYRTRVRELLRNKQLDPNAAFQDTIRVTMSQYHYRRRPWSVDILKELDIQKSMHIYQDRFADASDFTFILVGNFVEEDVKLLIRTYLGSLPQLDRAEKWQDIGVDAPQEKIEKQVVKGVEPKSYVNISFTGPFTYNKLQRRDLQSAVNILRIKLREKVREEKGGTYGVRVYLDMSEYPEEEFRLDIQFGCDPERVDELTQAVMAEMETLQTEGPKTKDLEKVKEIYRRSREVDLKQNKYWLNKLEYYYFHNLDPVTILEMDQLMSELTAQDVQQALQRYIDLEKPVRVVLYPENRKMQ